MRDQMIIDSAKNPANLGGQSPGVDKDYFKIGGGRAYSCDEDYGLCGYSKNQARSPLGGHQGGAGRLWGLGDYSPGSFRDGLVEYYAGPHDWFSQGFYDDYGNYMHTPDPFLGKVNTAVSAGNVFLATPFVASHFVTNNMAALQPVLSE